MQHSHSVSSCPSETQPTNATSLPSASVSAGEPIGKVTKPESEATRSFKDEKEVGRWQTSGNNHPSQISDTISNKRATVPPMEN